MSAITLIVTSGFDQDQLSNSVPTAKMVMKTRAPAIKGESTYSFPFRWPI